MVKGLTILDLWTHDAGPSLIGFTKALSSKLPAVFNKSLPSYNICPETVKEKECILRSRLYSSPLRAEGFAEGISSPDNNDGDSHSSTRTPRRSSLPAGRSKDLVPYSLRGPEAAMHSHQEVLRVCNEGEPTSGDALEQNASPNF